MDTLAVVIPARNEIMTIKDIVGRAKAMGCHVLVVDDASDDGTAMAAYKAGAEVLALKRQAGNFKAIQAGMDWLFNHENYAFPWVATIDADGQHDPEQLPILLACAKRAPGRLVIGACPERSSWMRQMVWAFFRRLSGLKVKDMTSGFKVYPRKAALALCAAPNLGYQDVPTLLFLARRGFEIREVPVSMFPRRAGISRVFSSWGKVAVYMVRSSLSCLAHRLKTVFGGP